MGTRGAADRPCDGEEPDGEMKKSIKINYIYNLSYQIIALAVPLVTTPYISRILGASGVGDYSYTSGIVSYFGLAAATGTVYFAQREIAVCQNDKMRRSVLFWETFLFRALSCALVFGVYTLFSLNFLTQYRTLFLIQYLTVFSWLADISWYFQGTENFRITSVRSGLVKLAGTILIFILVRERDDLWLYTLIVSGTALAGNLAMWGYAVREILWPGFKKIRIFRNVKDIMGLFVPVVSIQLYTVLDKTMLGTLCSTQEVGYYSQAEKIIRIALTLPSAFIAVLSPRMAVFYRNGDSEKIEEYYEKTLGFLFLLSMPMLAGCFLLAGEFVPVFFGKGYRPVIRLMRMESLLFIILSLGQMFGNFLIAMSRQRRYTTAVSCAAVVNVALNYVLIGRIGLGAAGACAASVSAEVVSTGMQLYFARDLLGCRPILRTFRRYVIPTGFMTVVVLAVQHCFDGAASLLLGVAAGALSYGLCLLIRREEIVMRTLRQLAEGMRRRW